MTMLRFCLFLAFALFAGGCNAVDLSQLNSSYDALVDKRKAGITDGLTVPKSPVSEDPGVQQQEGQAILSDRFGVLAQDAFALAGKASEPATQIAAYRIAGLAAWQHSSTDPLIDDAQTAGLAVCDNLSEDAIGAPRDCAILRYLKIMAGYEEIAQAMNKLSDPTQENLAVIQNNWLTGMGSLGETEMTAWSDITSSSRAYAGINGATLDYFKAVTFVSACLVEIAHRKSQVAAAGGNVPAGYDATVATQETRFLPVLKATSLLKDQSAETWFGSPDINCRKFLQGEAPSLLENKENN